MKKRLRNLFFAVALVAPMAVFANEELSNEAQASRPFVGTRQECGGKIYDVYGNCTTSCSNVTYFFWVKSLVNSTRNFSMLIT